MQAVEHRVAGGPVVGCSAICGCRAVESSWVGSALLKQQQQQKQVWQHCTANTAGCGSGSNGQGPQAPESGVSFNDRGMLCVLAQLLFG
jgi:hypothetical protein